MCGRHHFSEKSIYSYEVNCILDSTSIYLQEMSMGYIWLFALVMGKQNGSIFDSYTGLLIRVCNLNYFF